MRVLELRGYKSYLAFQAFHTLMLGLKMLPAYMGEQYEDFYNRLEAMDAAAQRKLIREAATFVQLQKEEVEALLGFCTDKNGVPYSAENLKNLGPGEIIDCVVEVCFAISQIKVTLVSESEKKN